MYFHMISVQYCFPAWKRSQTDPTRIAAWVVLLGGGVGGTVLEAAQKYHFLGLFPLINQGLKIQGWHQSGVPQFPVFPVLLWSGTWVKVRVLDCMQVLKLRRCCWCLVGVRQGLGSVDQMLTWSFLRVWPTNFKIWFGNQRCTHLRNPSEMSSFFSGPPLLPSQDLSGAITLAEIVVRQWGRWFERLPILPLRWHPSC